MEVTIKSMVSAVGGHATIATDPSSTVHSLITAFCGDKHIILRSDYVIRNIEQEILDSRATLYDSGVKNGETLFISNRDVSERGFCCRGCNQWWALAVVLFLIGVGGILTVSLLRAKSRSQPQDYGVVIDAGSSHSQIFVYKWPADKENGTGLVHQLYTERADGGGISSYTDHPPQAGKSLEPILDSAVKHVPAEQRDVTPIFLGATAGMRLLEASDNDTCQQILTSVRDTFNKYPFWFNNTHRQARILEGIDEGTFSWVTANFLSDSFGQYSITWNGVYGSIPTYTYGALDLGGASTQNTFIPGHPVIQDYAEDILMYGTDYTVYSHSYLCYGMNEAFRKLTAHLVMNELSVNASATIIENPCQPMGNTSMFTYSDVFEAPCTNELTPNATLQNVTFTFVGTSDTEQCSTITRALFDLDNENCTDIPCSFNNVHQPLVSGNFYAFSGYWNTMNFLNVTNSTLTEFETATDVLCAKNWTQVSAMPAPPFYLVRYCFDAHYIHALLIDGYKFSDATWNNIQFKKSINNAELGWSLGFMLNSTNRFPERHPQTYITLTMTILLILFFVIFLGIALAFGCHAKQRQHSRHPPYAKLSSYGAI